MATTRFKGETAGERLDLSGISDNDMIQLRHQPGTIEDADKGISKSQLLSCPFGVSDTSASTGAKVASLTDSNPDFTLVSGREVVVCFTTANSASNPTLNFAGSGAIPIYYPNGQTVGAWPAETWMHLKYFYATVGNSTIQRWILLSPLPVDVVAANNMQAVTSNAVAVGAYLKSNFENFTLLCNAMTTGEILLSGKFSDFSLIMVGIAIDGQASKRMNVQLLPTLILKNRDNYNNSVVVDIFVNPSTYISCMFYYVDDTHINVAQLNHSSGWSDNGKLVLWGIK